MPSPAALTAISWHASLDAAGESIAARLGSLEPQPLSVVPSSLTASDIPASTLRAALRMIAVRTSMLVPRAPVAAVLTRGEPSRWTSVLAADRTWRLDARLRSSAYIAVTTVDETLRRGPFVLDIPSRFLHPGDRLVLAARQDRHRALADLAATALPACSVILMPIVDGWLTLATTDPVAAELWCLAGAERFLARDLEMQGPWEDPTVQRATELELGARYPGELTVRVRDDTDIPAAARKLLYSMSRRLGVSPVIG